MLISVPGALNPLVLKEGILRLGKAYAAGWKSISNTALSSTVLLIIQAPSTELHANTGERMLLSGYLTTCYQGSGNHVLEVEVRATCENGDPQVRNLLRLDYPETLGPLPDDLPKVACCPYSKPSSQDLSSRALVDEAVSQPSQVLGDRAREAQSSLALDGSVAYLRTAQVIDLEVEATEPAGSPTALTSTIDVETPTLFASSRARPTRRRRDN